MKYEFSIALKYLLPRFKQLSVSIISLLSVLVISLVVWLILIFLSVTDGLEKNWIDKLVSINAPLRILPSTAYYNSYYYQIDSVSDASEYRFKTIAEKKTSEASDPYDSEFDQSLPFPWPVPDKDSQGNLRDLVKLAYESVDSLKEVSGVIANDFEIALSQLKFNTLREITGNTAEGVRYLPTDSSHTFVSYVSSFQEKNPKLSRILLEPSSEDLSNLLKRLFLMNSEQLPDQLNQFFEPLKILSLKTSQNGWIIPRHIIPKRGSLKVCTLEVGGKINQLIIPKNGNDCQRLSREIQDEGFHTSRGLLSINENQFFLHRDNEKIQVDENTPLVLESDILLKAQLEKDSILKAKHLSDLQFEVSAKIQDLLFEGKVSYIGLELGESVPVIAFSQEPVVAPHWLYRAKDRFFLPQHPEMGYGVLLAKNFKSNGILLGDQGQISYLSSAAGSMEEQHIPIYVAGFYDPGIIPLAGKLIMAAPELTTLVRSSLANYDQGMLNGIQIWFEQVDRAAAVKKELEKNFAQRGISSYWTIESYHDYEFSKDLLNQLRSDKNLFTLIALIIILVACSNIISMLILLVNDKKREVGILQSMGASSRSIALIFGTCGVVMGLVSSLIGTVAAYFTLSNLHSLIALISSFQGYDAFNTVFYGGSLPNQMSSSALSMVWIATTIISLLAGLVPAIKASMLKPTAILRSE